MTPDDETPAIRSFWPVADNPSVGVDGLADFGMGHCRTFARIKFHCFHMMAGGHASGLLLAGFLGQIPVADDRYRRVRATVTFKT
jgi:hypothetical protein